MDFAQKKYEEIKKALGQALSFGEAKSVFAYENLVKEIVVEGKTKRVWTEAFQAAIEESEHVYLPTGEYYLDDTVVIPSNRKISADRGAVVLLLKGTKVVMFRNEHVIDGTSSLITLDQSHEENIEIDGGVWGTEYTSRAKYGEIGAYDNEDSMHGVHALMLFSGVRNLWIKNVTYQNAATFALQVGRAENFLIESMVCRNCFADGVHLNGAIKSGVVFNVHGHTEDDLVALNAYDWDNSTINNGPMEDITVSRVYSSGGHCHCMRIQAGITSAKQGSIDCFIKDTHISNITGVQTFKLYLQTAPYVGEPEGAGVGRIENITFENIQIEKTQTSDYGDNYIVKDLVTGHFGIFEMNSDIDKITLKNIDFKLPLEEYPDTAHFITVGPKSRYLAERNLEIFDPYASSEVQELVYGNITVQGKAVGDIERYIKEIEFDNIYPSPYSSGKGKLHKTTKL